MPVETESIFARVIQDHLELKARNAGLDGDMPLDRYTIDDPFENHPLFKSEEQARIEETLDGRAGRRAAVARARRGPARRRDEQRRRARARREPLGPLPRLRLGRLSSPPGCSPRAAHVGA